jgi:hypothetical protein
MINGGMALLNRIDVLAEVVERAEILTVAIVHSGVPLIRFEESGEAVSD